MLSVSRWNSHGVIFLKNVKRCVPGTIPDQHATKLIIVVPLCTPQIAFPFPFQFFFSRKVCAV